MELITISTVIIQSIWHNSKANFLRLGKFPFSTTNLRFLWRHLPTELRYI